MSNNLGRRGFLKAGLVLGAGAVLAFFGRMLGRTALQPVQEPEPEPVVGEAPSRVRDVEEREKPPGEHAEVAEVTEKTEKKAADKLEQALKEGRWTRPLGETGQQVSIFGLGGGALLAHSQRGDEAAAIVDRALDLGVNYIDTAPSYGAGGAGEKNLGPVMKRRRKDVFLATKTNDFSYDGTMRLAERSLERLQTDCVDLYQLHGVRDREDVKKALGHGGAVQAMEKLRSEGVIRFLGITAHRDPDPLVYAMEEYPFDCILLPLNPGDVHYNSFAELPAAAAAKGIGVIAMKVVAYGRLFREGGITTMEQALGYVLTRPVSTAIVGVSSLEELEENVRVAREFRPFTPGKMSHLEVLAEPYAEEINFFKVQW